MGTRNVFLHDAHMTHKVDGRRERTKRTHAAIVEALTALLDEGRIEPTAAEIAARAGVATRSVGQHFASRELLMLAVAAHHQARFTAPLLDARAPLPVRLSSFVRDRTRILEGSRAMRRAAAVVADRSSAVANALARVARQRRQESARLFATEIARSDDPSATERTVALLTSGRAWDALREDLGMSTKKASDQVARMLADALRR
ncbi:MAG: TetR/AcrR family transcriptional regulator [Myxococcaceae bacterium]|nr:TetR/AcrR family transcriptional regulator [Myxococcaceae bacterium]